jgi:hypothetical protein
MEVKKEPKISMAATRRNLFMRSKTKTNPSNPKGQVSNLKAPFKKRVDARAKEFFFRKNRFFSDKKS